ncbi:MAG: hypothetical protein HYX63_04730 [Gammaproteobacteria bacterium]|nr:hypothetical protein [Gammaproteobacteria bacterium]
MNVYAVDKLTAEARRLAAEYRRVTGKTLPLSGEIAVNDAIRLLRLEPPALPTAGYDAMRQHAERTELIQIKARVVFDELKGPHRLGELKLDKPWDTLLVVLMNADYEPVEIYSLGRAEVIAALEDRSPQQKSSLTVARAKRVGTLVWTVAHGPTPGPLSLDKVR